MEIKEPVIWYNGGEWDYRDRNGYYKETYHPGYLKK